MILSPHHPGYYPPLTRCRWTINVPRGNTIKLRFLEFQLEDHPSCLNDFLDIYSGPKPRKFMGRYCGERFPALLVSSSNAMTITFVSNGKVSGSGFKLHYKGEELHLDGCDWVWFIIPSAGTRVRTSADRVKIFAVLLFASNQRSAFAYGFEVILKKTCTVPNIKQCKHVLKETMDSIKIVKRLITFPKLIHSINYIQDGRLTRGAILNIHTYIHTYINFIKLSRYLAKYYEYNIRSNQVYVKILLLLKIYS